MKTLKTVLIYAAAVTVIGAFSLAMSAVFAYVQAKVHKEVFTLSIPEARCLAGDLSPGFTINGYDMADLTQYAEKLRKNHNDIHIYMVDDKYEVWRSGVWAGKLGAFDTLSGAQQYVAEYYIEWARNCMGPVVPGELVE